MKRTLDLGYTSTLWRNLSAVGFAQRKGGLVYLIVILSRFLTSANEAVTSYSSTNVNCRVLTNVIAFIWSLMLELTFICETGSEGTCPLLMSVISFNRSLHVLHTPKIQETTIRYTLITQFNLHGNKIYLIQLARTNQSCVRLLRTPFSPAIFHFSATLLFLCHGSKFLLEPCTLCWTPFANLFLVLIGGLDILS